MKHKVDFCWECGRKLWGGQHVIKEIDGHPRVLHKACSKKRLPEK